MRFVEIPFSGVLCYTPTRYVPLAKADWSFSVKNVKRLQVEKEAGQQFRRILDTIRQASFIAVLLSRNQLKLSLLCEVGKDGAEFFASSAFTAAMKVSRDVDSSISEAYRSGSSVISLIAFSFVYGA